MLWVGHMRGHFKDNIDNLELGGDRISGSVIVSDDGIF